MRVKYISSFFIAFGIAFSFAQLSVTKEIKSTYIASTIHLQYIILPHVDIEKALEEDAAAAKRKDVPLRFGLPIFLNLDFYKSCQTSLLPDGGSIHQLALHAKSAKSLNLTFSSFYLSAGSWMHIYSPNKKEVIGAFTSANNREDGLFATIPIFNDSLIIEIYTPNNYKRDIKLQSVVFGYTSLTSKAAQFGSSGNCNINVVCPIGKGWEKQAQAAVLILTGANNSLCSGSLINNVREDGKPFLLSADHCPISNNNIVVFNYQSSICSPSIDSSFAHSINGLKILSRNKKSDFLLAKLNKKPPKSFNPVYAGWNNSGDVPIGTTVIHHPQGDVKKISFDYKASVSSGYYTKGNNHWMVTYWDTGTTENISSGSPLFDKQKRIVGQLHGGDASCQNYMDEDYFGKFSVSWDLNSDSSKQLKYWLDPNNTGASTIGEYNPNSDQHEYDIALMGFVDFENKLCNANMTSPQVLVKNRGDSTIHSYIISYYLNNIEIFSDTINTPLKSGKFYHYFPPPFSLNEGISTLKASVFQNSDKNSSNNDVSTEISVTLNPIMVELTLHTDNDGNETNWELLSSTNSLLASGGDYPSKPGGILYKDTFCLYDGCFKFSIYDDFGDGICCSHGKGYYVLKNLATGDTIVKNYDFTSSDSSHSFCLGDSCTIRSRAHITNTSGGQNLDGEVWIEMISGFAPFKYLWSTGDTTNTVTDLGPGGYWVRVGDSLDCFDTVFVFVEMGPSGRKENNSLGKLTIYPNPSSGKITIGDLPLEGENIIVVYDLRGRELKRKTISDKREMELDLLNLENGMYLIRIINESESAAYRIVLNR